MAPPLAHSYVQPSPTLLTITYFNYSFSFILPASQKNFQQTLISYHFPSSLSLFLFYHPPKNTWTIVYFFQYHFYFRQHGPAKIFPRDICGNNDNMRVHRITTGVWSLDLLYNVCIVTMLYFSYYHLSIWPIQNTYELLL